MKDCNFLYVVYSNKVFVCPEQNVGSDGDYVQVAWKFLHNIFPDHCIWRYEPITCPWQSPNIILLDFCCVLWRIAWTTYCYSMYSNNINHLHYGTRHVGAYMDKNWILSWSAVCYPSGTY